MMRNAVVVPLVLLSVLAIHGDTLFTAASTFGGANSVFHSTVIQSDGALLAGGTIYDPTVADVTPLLLNDATRSSAGLVVRLSADGQTVLSVVRMAERVLEVKCDANDSIYVLTTDGVFMLDPGARTLVATFPESVGGRMDVDGDHLAVLSGRRTISIYSTRTRQRVQQFDGLNRCVDIAIDDDMQHVYSVGRKSTRGPSGNPVHIAYLRCQRFDGTEVWKGYDWTGEQVDEPNENNMADTYGARIVKGEDGKLYAAFITEGGNHIFRYSPFDLSERAPLAGGDWYHQFYRSKSEQKTFIGRYDPATGAILLGQQFTGREPVASNPRARKCSVQYGEIAVDKVGRLYFSGDAASGNDTIPTSVSLPCTFNPVPEEEFGSGPFLWIMSSDLKQRLFVGRLGAGINSTSHRSSTREGRALAVRTLPSESNPRVFWGGKWAPSSESSVFWERHPVVSNPSLVCSGDDPPCEAHAFFAVYDGSTAFLAAHDRRPRSAINGASPVNVARRGRTMVISLDRNAPTPARIATVSIMDLTGRVVRSVELRPGEQCAVGATEAGAGVPGAGFRLLRVKWGDGTSTVRCMLPVL